VGGWRSVQRRRHSGQRAGLIDVVGVEPADHVAGRHRDALVERIGQPFVRFADVTQAPGGGFVFQQVHNIMADVPPRNIVAMFDADFLPIEIDTVVCRDRYDQCDLVGAWHAGDIRLLHFDAWIVHKSTADHEENHEHHDAIDHRDHVDVRLQHYAGLRLEPLRRREGDADVACRIGVNGSAQPVALGNRPRSDSLALCVVSP